MIAIRIGGGGCNRWSRVHAAAVDVEARSAGRADVESRRYAEPGHIQSVADDAAVDIASLRPQLLFASPLRASIGKPHLSQRALRMYVL